jgi:hypothetical protein
MAAKRRERERETPTRASSYFIPPPQIVSSARIKASTHEPLGDISYSNPNIAPPAPKAHGNLIK